jgi:hypothetical protein
MLLMQSFVIFEGHGKVIHIDFQPALHNFFLKDVVHHHLKGHGRVSETKEHNCWFKETFTRLEGCFPLISLFDLNIVIALSHVKLREQLMSC